MWWFRLSISYDTRQTTSAATRQTTHSGQTS